MQLPLFSGRAPRPGASRAQPLSGRQLNPPLNLIMYGVNAGKVTYMYMNSFDVPHTVLINLHL